MSDSPYDYERLITVKTLTTPWEAQLDRARLEAEGIHAVVTDENFVRLYGALSDAVGGVKLQVREEDVERALEILRTERPIPEIYLVKDEEDGPFTEEETMDEEPGPGDLVTVARFTTPWEAHLARTRLEADGIEAAVFEERLPLVSLLSGEVRALNRLEVHPEDAERALEILGEVEEAGGEGL